MKIENLNDSSIFVLFFMMEHGTIPFNIFACQTELLDFLSLRDKGNQDISHSRYKVVIIY